MVCYSAIRIRNPANEKEFVTVPCGKCSACKVNRRKEWSFRLEQELKVQKKAVFVTLTYTDRELPVSTDGEVVLRRKDVQDWMKRLRKSLNPIKVKYYLVGEYGSKTHRPHYHAILYFNKSIDDNELHLKMLKTWNKGIVHLGSVTEKSIRYTTKYMLKQQDNRDKDYRPFSLMSKGLGKNYIDSKKVWHRSDRLERNYVINPGGTKSRLPRYYREKIYTKMERQMQSKLIREKINKNEADDTAKQVRLRDERKIAFEREIKKRQMLNDKL